MEKYRLENAEKLRKANPRTFKLLPKKDRRSLRTGDFAKLLFTFKRPNPPGGERMWVQVETWDPDRKLFVGFLSNKPAYAPGLKIGDIIVFKPENVFMILRKEDAEPSASDDEGNINWTHKTCNDPKGKMRCWRPQDN